MNGGYCMIDLTGVDTSVSEAQEINGIYSKVYDCMSLNKPVIFNNVLMGGNALATPIVAVCSISGNTITARTVIGTMTITSDDNVVVTQ